MSLSPTDALALSVAERMSSVSRRHLAHLMATSPMTAGRAAERLVRAGVLMETYGIDLNGRRGRLLTVNPTPPLLWLDLSDPHTSAAARLTDSLLRPLCRIERRYSELHSDEDNLRLLLNELCRHPAAARSLASAVIRLGIAVTLPHGTQELSDLLREVVSDLFPRHHMTIVPREAALTEACLHAVPLDCKQLLYVHTGNAPHASTLKIERRADGTTHVCTEDESVLTDTLSQYLQSDPETAVSRFVLDYRRFHAPSPTVWVDDTARHPTAEDVIRLTSGDAVARGSLLKARRAGWIEKLSTM